MKWKNRELFLAELIYCGLSIRAISAIIHKPEDFINAEVKMLMKRTKTKTRKDFRKKLTLMKREGLIYA